MTRLLILSAHAILEHDDLRLFSDAGYDVFIPGAYSDPSHPGVEFGREPFRPALPDAPHHPELEALCHAQRVGHGEVPEGVIDWAKADLHPDLIDWADVIMVNCFPVEWIVGQWSRIRHKRVIWRTIGQSGPYTEHRMASLRPEGLQVVRYSPAERRAFEPTGSFAGEDAMIRFAKYPADYGPWRGDTIAVGNVTQDMAGRGEHCGLGFWQEATAGLPVAPAGLRSDALPGGLGALSYPAMLDYLAGLRVYLYTGTQPASYTLGLMEAMLTGTPVVSRGPADLWLPALFEGHELTGLWSNDPARAGDLLRDLLADRDLAASWSVIAQTTARRLFDAATIGAQWKDFLG